MRRDAAFITIDVSKLVYNGSLHSIMSSGDIL
jgi:hypothetical protein